MNDTTDELRAVVSSGLVRTVGGPSFCDVCNEWPACMTDKGMRCHMCWTRDVAAAHPVPLPDSKKCLEDLAGIGVPGAAQKLAERWPNSDSAWDENAVWRLLDDLWRQYPRWPSTFGPCSNKCGSGHAGRGSGPCRTCVERELARHIGEVGAREYHSAIQRVRALEMAMFREPND